MTLTNGKWKFRFVVTTIIGIIIFIRRFARYPGDIVFRKMTLRKITYNIFDEEVMTIQSRHRRNFIFLIISFITFLVFFRRVFFYFELSCDSRYRNYTMFLTPDDKTMHS